MNLNRLIIDTLSRHGPVLPDFYDGGKKKYITFNYPDEKGTLFGDNRPQRAVAYVQVHLYLPDADEYQKEKEEICRELKAAGFLWPEVTVLHEAETRKRHLVFETQIKKKIKWEE